jgi:hypothetical protein
MVNQIKRSNEPWTWQNCWPNLKTIPEGSETFFNASTTSEDQKRYKKDSKRSYILHKRVQTSQDTENLAVNHRIRITGPILLMSSTAPFTAFSVGLLAGLNCLNWVHNIWLPKFLKPSQRHTVFESLKDWQSFASTLCFKIVFWMSRCKMTTNTLPLYNGHQKLSLIQLIPKSFKHNSPSSIYKHSNDTRYL